VSRLNDGSGAGTARSPPPQPCERLRTTCGPQGLAFTVRDVLADPDAADFLEERAIYLTPVLAVGEELVAGFDRAQLDLLLNLGRDRGAQR
jgi:hypothetical protein